MILKLGVNKTDETGGVYKWKGYDRKMAIQNFSNVSGEGREGQFIESEEEVKKNGSNPEPTSEMETIRFGIRFIWKNWFIAILQSILFFKNVVKIPTHVQVPYDNEGNDLSAEICGVKLVKAEDTIKKARKHEYYESDVELALEDYQEIMNMFKGKNYDFFLYPSWWLNVSLAYIPAFLIFLGMPSLGRIGLYLGIYALSWIVLKFIFKLIGKKCWACSEKVSAMCEIMGIPFGFEKHSISSPFYEWLMVKFAGWPKK